MTRRILSILAALVISPLLFVSVNAQSLARHQVWVDDNFEQRLDKTSSEGTVTFGLDVSELSEGIHFVSFRSQNDSYSAADLADFKDWAAQKDWANPPALKQFAGAWGTVKRALFYKPFPFAEDETNVERVWETWLDNNFDDRVTSKGSEAIALEFDIERLSEGFHFVSSRGQHLNGTWGAVKRIMFYKHVPHSNDPDFTERRYECWIDSDFEHRVSGKVDQITTVELDIDALPAGLHFCNVRSQFLDGSWGTVKRILFYKDGTRHSEPAEYEYWIDDRKVEGTGECSGDEFNFEVNIDKLERGEHQFYFRYRESGGNWSLCSELTFTTDFLEGKCENVTFDYDGESQLSITSSTPGAKVSYRMDDEADFQPLDGPLTLVDNRAVWAFAAAEHYLNSDTIAFTPENFSVGHLEVMFEEPMLRMWCETEDVEIHYTLDGSEPTEQSAVYEEAIEISEPCVVKAIAMKPYFNSAKAVYEVKRVPTPVISIIDGMITMTCDEPDAEIFYTLDGSEPSMESAFYQEPVACNENVIVKAVAYAWGMLHSAVAVKEQNDLAVALPTFRYDGESQLAIISETPNAQIFFRIEDMIEQWTEYRGVLTLESNRKVFAYATAQNLNDSEVAEFAPQNFTVGEIHMAFEEPVLHIMCETEDAEVHLTLDGSEPTEQSHVVGRFVEILEPCVAQAVGMKPYFNNSPLAAFEIKRAAMPEIQNLDGTIKITCDEPDAEIFFTLDGSEPTQESISYREPFVCNENVAIKAVAYVRGMLHSETATLYLNDNSAATPTFSYDDLCHLEITSATSGARVYYKVENLIEQWTEYVDVLTLESNRKVFAYASAPNLNDSPVAEFAPNNFECDSTAVSLSFVGPWVVVNSADPEMELTLVVNGEPMLHAEDGARIEAEQLMQRTYGGEEVGELWLYVELRKPYFNDNVTKVYPLPFFVRESIDETAHETGNRPYLEPSMLRCLDTYLFVPGRFAEAIDWWKEEGMPLHRIVAHIQMAESDIESLRLTDVRHIDLTDLHHPLSLADNAFADCRELISIALPEEVENVGAGIFAHCPNLATIEWNSQAALSNDALGVENPNLLLYVNDRALAPSNLTNVVANGEADRIILSNPDEQANTYGNFYCTRPFTAARISYDHDYSMLTGREFSRGWETLALPFRVETIWHSTLHTEIAPFLSLRNDGITDFNADSETKPFWLYELGYEGFEETDEIQPYTPYIISMPNSNDYIEGLRLPGTVSFRAENAVVEPIHSNIVEGIGMEFVPTTLNVEQSPTVFAINAYDESNPSLAYGSAFLADYRDVRPFESYLFTFSTFAPLTALPLAELDLSHDVSAMGQITVSRTDSRAYNLQGQRVGSGYKGIVIQGGRKYYRKHNNQNK